MEFELSEQQLMFRTLARDFAQKEVKPVAQEFDRQTDPLKCIPLDLYQKGFGLDFHKMVIPEKHGGMGLDCLTSCLILEELAAGDPGYALTWHVNNIGLTFMYNQGAESQQLEFVRPVLQGGVTALSTTEPDGGVTSVQVLDIMQLVYKTTARLEGNQYVVNGAKVFCSNSGLPFCKWALVYVRTDMTKVGPLSLGALVIPMGTPGFEVSGEEDKMGHRLSSTASLAFNDCKVPRNNRLAGGTRCVTYDHDSAVAAIAIGIARSAYEAALDFARTRIVLGKPILKNQMIMDKFANMWINLDTARTYMWRVANYSDTHAVMDMKYARAVKVYCTEAAGKVVDDAVQVFGGAGYCKSTPVEKAYRDVRVSRIYEGTNEALRLSLAAMIDANT